MRHGGSHGHPPLIAKSRHEGIRHPARCAVAFDQRDLASIALGFDKAVVDDQLFLKRLCGSLILHDTDDICTDGVRALRGGDGKIIPC